jgi:hypothetical protein
VLVTNRLRRDGGHSPFFGSTRRRAKTGRANRESLALVLPTGDHASAGVLAYHRLPRVATLPSLDLASRYSADQSAAHIVSWLASMPCVGADYTSWFRAAISR